MKLTVYGNCQSDPILKFIALLDPTVEPVVCPMVHLTPKDRPDQVLEQVEKADVVLYQPITAEAAAIGTDALQEAVPHKTYISFPSIFFSGFVPHVFNMSRPGGSVEIPGIPWRDIRIWASWLNGQSEARCLEMLHDDDTDYVPAYEKSLAVSRHKDAAVDIPVMPFAETLMQQQNCFYENAHPCNRLLWHVAHKALQLLGRRVDPATPMPDHEMLRSTVAQVPDSLPRHFGCDWREPDYLEAGRVVSLERIVAASYAAFASLDAAPEEIYRLNASRIRFSLPGRAGALQG